MIVLIGTAALSNFRKDALLQRLRSRVPHLKAITAIHAYLIDTDRPQGEDEFAKLRSLLPLAPRQDRPASGIIVVPRIGTISPWSSKATDIAHNAGLTEIRRIEQAVH